MRLTAVLKLKCPHCLNGSVFKKPLKMYPDCPHCGIHFEREEGYFMMSVFVGYVMSFFIAVPTLIIMYLTMTPTIWEYVFGALLVLLIFSPLVFHYARVVWMHLDELMDPRRPDELEKAAARKQTV